MSDGSLDSIRIDENKNHQHDSVFINFLLTSQNHHVLPCSSGKVCVFLFSSNFHKWKCNQWKRFVYGLGLGLVCCWMVKAEGRQKKMWAVDENST